MGIRSKKIWLDRRSKKLRKKAINRNPKSYYKKAVGNERVPLPIAYNNEYKALAPEIFSYIYNTDETAGMFVGVIEEINRGIYGRRFFFDSSSVENVTTEVLVYIIAIICNMKFNKIKQYSFAGNLPKNESAKKVFEESGFYKFVQTRNRKLPSNSQKMQIVSGKKTDSVIAGQICKFVMDKLDKDKVYTQFIYKTIVELMSNVVHHAYHDKEEIMYPCWYLYSEYDKDKVRFIFVDTGLGIATTVRKKIYENIKFIVGDADLIESSFAGENRTETRQHNRGLGLPALKEYVIDGKFSSFFVISGSGGYKYISQGKFEKVNLRNKIYGTIYILEVDGKEKIYEN